MSGLLVFHFSQCRPFGGCGLTSVDDLLELEYILGCYETALGDSRLPKEGSMILKGNIDFHMRPPGDVRNYMKA